MSQKRSNDLVANGPEKRQRLVSFRPEFTETWPFIIKTPTPERARCTICNCEFSIGHMGKHDCQRHVQSQRHQKIAAASKGNTTLSAFMRPSNPIDNAVTQAEIIFTSFLVEHNVALSASDHASKLFQAMFLKAGCNPSDIIKRYACARTKTTAIVNTLAEREAKDLIHLMKTNPFSLATDASNDKNEKLFPIVVRLEEGEEIKTRLLSVIELNAKATGANIAAMILKDLGDKGIPVANFMAFTTDNCNAMIGRKNGAYGHLLNVQPNLILTGCVCHRIHLAAEWGLKTLSRNIPHLFIDIYYYIDKSSNRANSYQETQEAHGVRPSAVPKHCPTRWLSLANTCLWVIENWGPLKAFFIEELKTDGSGRCKFVVENLQSKTVRALITYLGYVLPIFTSANLKFQEEQPQIHRQRRLMLKLVTDLQLMFIKDSITATQSPLAIDVKDPMYQLSNRDVMIGRECRGLLSGMEENKIKDFLASVKQFLSTSTAYLMSNLPFHEAFIRHVEVADPTLKSSSSFDSITYFLDKFPSICPPETSCDNLELEFRKFRGLQLENTVAPVTSQWQALGKRQNDLGEIILPHLPKVMLNILSIPHSNASCERIFSFVRKNRTDFRSNMSVSTLESLLILKQAGGACYDQKPDQVLIKACKQATKQALSTDGK